MNSDPINCGDSISSGRSYNLCISGFDTVFCDSSEVSAYIIVSWSHDCGCAGRYKHDGI